MTRGWGLGGGENKSPRPALRPDGGQSGGGSSPRSLSRSPALGATVGRRLPDAVLHGKRSFRPRSRAVRRLSAGGFRVRPLSPLGPAVAPPGRGQGPDTPVSAVRVWTWITGTAPADGGALARCDGSGLLPLGLPCSHRPAVPKHRRRCGGKCPAKAFRLAEEPLRLSRLSAAFVGRASGKGWRARVGSPVLARSSSRAPVG